MKNKFPTWEECVRLREVKSLHKLRHHPNVINLKEAIRENDELYLVFEFMRGSLYEDMSKQKSGYPEGQIRAFM